MSIIPPAIIEGLRKQLDPTPCSIVQSLVAAGHEAFIVGGAIRDLLLNVPPKDYDIATSATPEQIRQVFGRRRCHIIGRRFRLVHVYANSEPYEVSTFRRIPTEQERQGRRPSEGHIIWNDNSFGTLEEDATRRDFTVNALYFDVVGSRGLIDFWGGYDDLQNRVVRCIGDPEERMEEDPVRMLRALKLVGQFGFHLEESLGNAIRAKAESIRLASPSRLFEELLKILKHPAADQTLAAMHEQGFLKSFWEILDGSWDDQEGALTRHLLKLRGNAIRRGNYSNSRGLALATAATPFIMTAMNPEQPTDFWQGGLAYNPVARKALNLVFDGFQLPNAFAHRVLEIIGLLPKMLAPNRKREKLFQHVEYRYGRALLALLVQAFGWDAKAILGELPEFSPAYGIWEPPEELSGEVSQVNRLPDDNQELAEAQEITCQDTHAVKRKRPRRHKHAANSSPNSTPEATPEASADLAPAAPEPAAKEPSPEAAIVPLRKTEPPLEKPASHAREASVQKPRRQAKSAKPAASPEAASAAAQADLRIKPEEKPAAPKLVSLRKNGERVSLPVKASAQEHSSAPAEIGASFILGTAPKRRSAVATDSITFSPTEQEAPRKPVKHLKPLTSRRPQSDAARAAGEA